MERDDEKEFARRRYVQRSAHGESASIAVPGRTSFSQQQPAGSNGPYTGSVFGGGSALPSTVMRKFESSLGADLSGVRVHTRGESAQSARSLSARAYTVGQDIHFGDGQYDPSSPAGEHLLAHEVAHTVQQAAAGPAVQHKLEVSQPGDACELEADRAADSMIAGRSFAISPAAGVQRSIMRTPGDGSAPARHEHGGGSESTTGEAGHGDAEHGETGETAPRAVNTTWTINYDQVHTGNGAAARPRTAETALHVTYFGIRPDSGAVTPNTPFSGYNLQPAGRVTMGSRMHPRGQGGEASAALSYVRRTAVTIHVNGDPVALRAHGGRGALESGVRRALQARLAGAIDSQMFDDASLAQLLPEAARAAGITVTAGSHEPERAVVNAEALHYPAIHRDGQAMHVTVSVPNGEYIVRGSGEGAHDDETTTGTTDTTTTHDATEATTTTEHATRVATSVRASFESEVTRFAETATEAFFSGRLRDQLSATLRGEAEGTLSSSVAGQLPLSAIVAAAGMPELAPFIPESAGISATLSGALRLLLGLEVRNEIEGELLASHRTTHTERLQTQIRTSLMAQWDTELSTRFATAFQVTHGRDHTDGTTGGTRTSDHHASAHSSEGHGASTAGARPRLVLGNAVEGPEAPRVPTRIE